MRSLKDVYTRLVEHEKVAAAGGTQAGPEEDEQTKLALQQAYDYHQVGEELGRQVFRDLVKEATAHMPVGHGPGHRHEDGMPCGPSCAHHARGGAHAEKRASLARGIFERMIRDPAYLAELVARHRSG
jgi:hypothetical protein